MVVQQVVNPETTYTSNTKETHQAVFMYVCIYICNQVTVKMKEKGTMSLRRNEGETLEDWGGMRMGKIIIF